MDLAAFGMIKASEWKLIAEKLKARFASCQVAAAAHEAKAKKRALTDHAHQPLRPWLSCL